MFLCLHLLAWKPYFLFLWIWGAVGHGNIFTQFLLGHVAFLICFPVTRVTDKRHLFHFNDSYGGEVVVNFYGAQQKVASAALKRILFKASSEMRRIKKIPIGINPCTEIHSPILVGTCFLETR